MNKRLLFAFIVLIGISVVTLYPSDNSDPKDQLTQNEIQALRDTYPLYSGSNELYHERTELNFTTASRIAETFVRAEVIGELPFVPPGRFLRNRPVCFCPLLLPTLYNHGTFLKQSGATIAE
ncbi:hypothetical protein BCM02_106439 [Paenibacillus methanolicus]|uniref:Uncharacterized protein n=1 Tax=Paenibacillus methanolicus TaxID=582686 RepID=A0A5S5C4B7_9BACL|nr:hypothetical protein BCM02_106439 [Paenibacillus methanolicus]